MNDTDKVFTKLPPRDDSFFDEFDEEAIPPEEVPEREEFVVQRNGQVRQAGATQAEDAWIKAFRPKAEKHLYVFSKVVLGYTFLRAFHREMCAILQAPHPDPWRTLLLGPRDSGKSTLVGRAWPLHVVIQPKESNLYFTNQNGLDQRILLAGETETRAMSHISVLQQHADGNQLLRALWPHCFWESPPKRDWNAKALTFPYPYGPRPWPDPTIWASGVGGATTGSHPSAIGKDDIATFEAANSPVVMQTTIDWHVASRALINHPGCIEIMIGTRWAIYDVYAYAMERDPSIFSTVKSVIEDGKIIWPENYDPTGDGSKLDRLRKEFGVLFPLLYMNSASDPELTDFRETDLRNFTIKDGLLTFTEDARDLALAQMMNAPGPMPNADEFRGLPLTTEVYEQLRKVHGRYAAFRLSPT